MAKMAGGHANDLVSTLLMATDKRVLIAPSMNVRMWEHPATQRNLETLQNDGILVVGPNEGDMACGEYGPGRMAEVPEIIAAIDAALNEGPLKGKHVLMTSGPTHEPIDPVRYIANRSSGAQGTAIADALIAMGANVTFITGPAKAPSPQGCKIIEVTTAAEMMEATKKSLPADVAIFAAAVADWHIKGDKSSKIKKTKGKTGPDLEFEENPDILKTVSAMKKGRPELVIGFAAETDNVVANGTAKRERKGCDWILINDVSPETGIMGGRENDVTVISKESTEDWPRMNKTDVGRKLAAKIAHALSVEPDV
jgi:phosphopantothenoylcysteine decarboxylase/phosphopantothenate--cysteine ligase